MLGKGLCTQHQYLSQVIGGSMETHPLVGLLASSPFSLQSSLHSHQSYDSQSYWNALGEL